MRNATWTVEENTAGHLTIRDACEPRNMSVTNDVEFVVKTLTASGLLQNGKRLFYYDSEGRLDEIVHRDGAYLTFAPGPKPWEMKR